MEGIYNFNLGVLGHIDSGKTSIVRVLSSVLSTAALDKDPQSQERGITLDLGFSAFSVAMPARLSEEFSTLQVTLVDCPGHASLIRTIIAGASIIDQMLLVVDATKGVQMQTAECIVIGELMMKGKLIIALNKVDLVPEGKLALLEGKLRALMRNTRFGDNVVVVPIAASPREGPSIGFDRLIDAVVGSIDALPVRRLDEPLFFAIDHCFPMKGKGTVLTGTVLQGSLRVNDTIEILQLRIEKKIKSIQSFRRPVQSAAKGDRIGVLVTKFDSSLLERGSASTPRTLSMHSVLIVKVQRIPHFRQEIKTNAKFHVTCGNDTVMGAFIFFSGPTGHFEPGVDYAYEAALTDSRPCYALLQLETPICVMIGSLLIASKLDTSADVKTCRLAFHGDVELLNPVLDPSFLKIYKVKERVGAVERIVNEREAIGKQLFSKESDVSKFIGMKVLVGDAWAVIDSQFGQTGKYRLSFIEGPAQEGAVKLQFKKYMFDMTHKMVQ
jgi:selenocysteine-specific elongation factor